MGNVVMGNVVMGGVVEHMVYVCFGAWGFCGEGWLEV
jgi:hypothetical protein